MAETADRCDNTDDDHDDIIPDVVPKDSTSDCSVGGMDLPLAYLVVSGTKLEIGPSSSLLASSVTASSPSQRPRRQRRALVIGRQASTCDIRIVHKSLSRQHAVIYYYEQGLWIVDLATKTGTKVNGQKIQPLTPKRVFHDNTIQFGKATEIFVVEWDKTDPKESSSHDEKSPAVEKSPTSHDQQQEQPREEQPDFSHLSGRERRQAEIEAMMASFDHDPPTYTKYKANEESNESSNGVAATNTPINTNDEILNKHKLPLADMTPITTVGDSVHSHLSCIAMDPTGSRFAVGNMDSSLQLYDFAGYRQDPQNEEAIPFQNTYVTSSGEGGGSYPIRSMAYSPSGDRILIGLGSAQPQIMDRDGKEELLTFVRGDVYVTDPTKTLGHTAAVTSVAWHPVEKSIVFTTSRDGSLRAWDVDHGRLSFGMLTCNGKNDAIVVKSIKTGRKTIPTCLAVASPNIVAFGTECGNLQIFKYPFTSKLRPQQSIPAVGGGVHEDDVSVTSLVFSVDSSKLATRTLRTIKVWDMSSARPLSSSTTPWMQCLDLPVIDGDDDAVTDNSTPTMAFSPNARALCVATTSRDENNTDPKKIDHVNTIHVYVVPTKDARTNPSKPIYSFPIAGTTSPVTGMIWHSKLNQILLGTKSGFQIFYSDTWSKKGILLTANQRQTKKRRHGTEEDGLQDLYAARAPPPGSVVRQEEIIVPNALPLFADEKFNKKRKKKRELEEEAAADQLSRHIPQKDPTGSINQAGTIYSTSNTKFAQMIMDTQRGEQKRIAGMDPREALAAYSEGKSYIGKAYEGNVERILADTTVEEEEEQMKNKNSK